MPKLPILQGGSTTREMIDTFAGYNHNLKINDGEFYFTENLTTEYYPLLANRGRRGEIEATGAMEYSGLLAPYHVGDFVTHDHKLYRCNTEIASSEAWTEAHWDEKESMFYGLQAIIAKSDKLYWINDGCLYGGTNRALLNGLQTSVPPQVVAMGSYICIFPDKKYYNTLKPTDKGSMEASFQTIATSVPSYSMCHQDGTVYTNVTSSASEPATPSNGDLWIDTTDNVAKEYSEDSETWITLETVYTKVEFSSTKVALGDIFKEYDGVEISGLYYDDMNGSKILYGMGGDTSSTNAYIVIIGMVNDGATHHGAAVVKIQRKVPDMDYVCEAQNRLWGCRYGYDETLGETINELYCCALGDFKNWNQYLGVATDSWRASRGSDGPWTGCINYFGSPTFFKETIIHPISVSSIGAHQVGDIPARGVQEGSHKSLALVNETLYYKSRTGVMAYQGGIPSDVSAALGDVKYKNAVAGVHGQRYYISMQENTSADSPPWHFFCYDVSKGLWMREDSLHAEDFAMIKDELYVMSENHIYTINLMDGDPLASVHWIAETGIQHYAYPDKKYVSRYNIRLQMAKGSRVQMYIEYDSKGPWIFMGNISAGDIMTDNTGTANVPVRPRRCDHLRLRLEGTGDVRVLSITRVLQKGSDV